MRETGDGGFEGLVATLLTALTGDKFYVARSGDQPADAVASAADIAMQAKRYGKANVDETKFEGEFAQACRVIPNLDCYVFAVTRQTAQLQGPRDRASGARRRRHNSSWIRRDRFRAACALRHILAAGEAFHQTRQTRRGFCRVGEIASSRTADDGDC